MNKYHERFFNRMSSGSTIKIFCRYSKPGKEISESWAMLEAAHKYAISTVDESLVIVVGDGCSPRTGILFAYNTKAEVISIDPQFNMEHWNQFVKEETAIGYPPQRIKLIKDRVENIAPIECGDRDVIVIWPHSHADMRDLKLNNARYRTDIAMPCCKPVPEEFMRLPHICYSDQHVISPKRMVHIW